MLPRINYIFNVRCFYEYKNSVFWWSGSIFGQQIYAHGMVSMFMQLVEAQYRFRNQKRIIRCLGAIQTRQKKCRPLLPYPFFMMWWMIFWLTFLFISIVAMNRYRHKGLRQTTIKTVYGEVAYQRSVYEVLEEDDFRHYVYLLDETLELGMKRRTECM